MREAISLRRAHKEHLDRAIALADCYLPSSESEQGQEPDSREDVDSTTHTQEHRKGHTAEMIAAAESPGFLQAGNHAAETWWLLIGTGDTQLQRG
ncbi:hypothetical protein JOB18_000319 [Solea senegalensis]|uniref:Uncharacterized protein n=1 Tax=Solea senegalensis TaxID=28829 RepID=A0AAV6Q8Y3_SOLSE|nr:hypothetical protein JOB18_000319 [Solea senegalensis]